MEENLGIKFVKNSGKLVENIGILEVNWNKKIGENWRKIQRKSG